MEFDLTAEIPKFVMLGLGVIAFIGVVGAVLFLLDKAPARKDRWAAALFLAPASLLLLIGVVVPAIRTLLLALRGSSSQNFVGLDNFVWIFTQPTTLRTLLNTLLWVVLAPLLSTAIGLIYSVLVDRARMEAFAKSLIFMPMAISFVGAGIIWKFVYAHKGAEQEQIGLLNQIVVWFGGKPRQWIVDDPWNTLFLIAVLIWIQAGFAMVVLSAAIKAIPGDIVEAARLDGVTAWQMFWRVTIPSIRPAIVVVMVTITVATLKIFDIVRAMTGGRYKTGVLATDMYNYAFPFRETGIGSALAVLLFILVIPIVIYQTFSIRQREAR